MNKVTTTTLTAETAIEAIKSATTVFMGNAVKKNNYVWDIRNELEKMAESGKLSPKEYKRAINITFGNMSAQEKAIDYSKIND